MSRNLEQATLGSIFELYFLKFILCTMYMSYHIRCEQICRGSRTFLPTSSPRENSSKIFSVALKSLILNYWLLLASQPILHFSLMVKFDEVRTGGNMMPTATLAVGTTEGKKEKTQKASFQENQWNVSWWAKWEERQLSTK